MDYKYLKLPNWITGYSCGETGRHIKSDTWFFHHWCEIFTEKL